MPSPRVRPTDTLTTDERDAVRSLAARATQSDGVGALSEQTLFDLAAGPGRVRHVLAYAGEQLVGYAQLAGDGGAGDDRDGSGTGAAAEGAADGAGDEGARDDEGPSGELVVDPEHRRTGVGRALLEAVLAEAGEVRLWAHGNLPAARALAAAAGLETVRELHKMSRALTGDDATSAATSLPAGYTARAFEPGRDEQAWLATNAAAFA
ncbi:MAG TPA: GNAT family N-acetyltransferase, partial [Pedococcus sp.]|nr:GNAT family N-acetyltransferase [Pedococcus sp.]